MHEAIALIRNDGVELPPGFEKDMKWLRNLRNDIEHHRCTFEVEEVESAVGRLLHALFAFDSAHKVVELRERIEPAQLELFDALADTYAQRHGEAVKRIEAARRL